MVVTTEVARTRAPRVLTRSMFASLAVLSLLTGAGQGCAGGSSGSSGTVVDPAPPVTPGTSFLPPTDTRDSSAAAYRLQSGLQVLLLGFYPARDLLDWSDPPMASVSDHAHVSGCQFGTGPTEVSLQNVLTDSRLPSRLEGKHAFASYRADGWLWAEEEGTYEFRITSADDGGRVSIGNTEVVRRLAGESALVGEIDLQRGFHRLRLDGFNLKFGLSLRWEWRLPGANGFTVVPDAHVFRGHALPEGPPIFQVAVQDKPYAIDLPVTGGQAPHRLSIFQGSLPSGLTMDSDGRIRGTPLTHGFFRFAVRVQDAIGVTIDEVLGLRVLPAPPAQDLNDGAGFALTFDDVDVATLQGGLIDGRGLNEGLKTVGAYSVYPWHAALQGQTASIDVASANGGAYGTSQFARVTGTKEFGFYLSGQQSQLIADYAPALRNANRFSVAVRLPEQVSVSTSSGPQTANWKQDPKRYRALVLGALHMAGHNVTRFQGHEKEQWNWHFYHKLSTFWPDHWQAANLFWLGDGWWHYETSSQPAAQRTGTVSMASCQDPLADTDAKYFDTLSRIYHTIDLGSAATSNSYADHVFDLDMIRFYREETGFELVDPSGANCARVVTPDTSTTVDVPFELRNSTGGASAYWLTQGLGSVPLQGGAGIFIDANGNGVVDSGEAEIGLRTPVVAPGTKLQLVKQLQVDSLSSGRSHLFAVHARPDVDAEPLSLRGATLLVIVYKGDLPPGVAQEELTSRSGNPDALVANDPPSAQITGVSDAAPAVGQTITLTGLVSDADGPRQPLAVWEFGDATEAKYGTSVTHTFLTPGTYTVTLRASDSVRETRATTTIEVAP